MPYVATKPRLIAGHKYARGEAVDTSALTTAKLASLIRVGLLIQRDQAASVDVKVVEVPMVEAEPVEPEGEICPQCDEGPFQRLYMHMRIHEETN